MFIEKHLFKIVLTILVSLFIINTAAYSEISLNGLLRNDMSIGPDSNYEKTLFDDVLETRLIFTRKTEEWKFYADFRAYLYYGDSIQQEIQAGVNEAQGIIAMLGLPFILEDSLQLDSILDGGVPSLNLMRAFVRYYSPVGNITLGKTYINFGTLGIFNPFEMNKTVSMSDLSYDKSGILALSWEIPINDDSGVNIYIKPTSPLSNTGTGLSVYTHLWTFDMGAVYNRKGLNQNVMGVYFKGDIEVGIEGAWAFHIDDYGTNNFNEAKLGIDYSFFDGKLITAVVAYYSEAGAENTNDYDPLSTDDKFYIAKWYMYVNISFAANEFFSVKLDTFINLIDSSTIFIPSVDYTIANGLKTGLQFMYVLGRDDMEFSRDKLGEYRVNFRVEVKL